MSSTLALRSGRSRRSRAGSTRSRTESLLKLEPHVSQAVVIVRWAKVHGIDDASPEALAASPAVRQLIESEVAQVNRGLGSLEQVKCFRTFPRDLTVETAELSPTLKVKRKVVTERYRREIEEMYA
jgi:long-chain acyl-CoA synthetase